MTFARPFERVNADLKDLFESQRLQVCLNQNDEEFERLVFIGEPLMKLKITEKLTSTYANFYEPHQLTKTRLQILDYNVLVDVYLQLERQQVNDHPSKAVRFIHALFGELATAPKPTDMSPEGQRKYAETNEKCNKTIDALASMIYHVYIARSKQAPRQ
ncbi:MAG: hypothetical protein EZS28_026276 [Streblomastix strix]|uniref:Uncharacterized protein n=1 Tax=Streblomastix strix TaxID=222440 RepID=A0A5J4V6E7_9EUKA|nr:MAG: hypothetical protein EZS28_026276 [Streblomastix strix]